MPPAPRVNLARRDGTTPLDIARQKGDLAMVKALIGAGAHVNPRQANGGIAPELPRTEITRLLEARAKIETLDEAHLLRLFQHYVANYRKQLRLAPLLRFFNIAIGNHFGDVVHKALQLKESQNLSLEGFIGKINEISKENHINLQTYASGEFRALLHLSDLIVALTTRDAPPLLNTAESQLMPQS